jgi:hypothetical protein
MIGDKEIEEMFRGHWSETFEGMDDQGLFRYYHLGRQDRISGYAANHAHGYFVGFKACQELMQKRIEELEKQNEIMKEALSFYTDKNSWQTVQVGYGAFSQIKKEDLEDINLGILSPDEITCGGKRAREALKQIEENK